MSAARTQKTISRRDFLKISMLAPVVVLTPPLPKLRIFNEKDPHRVIGKGRVTTRLIYRYQEPSFRSPRLDTLKRDELIDLYEEIDSPYGPEYNPRWYRLEDGYAHSGYVQRVDGAYLNPQVMKSFPKNGRLAEVTVPITRGYRPAGRSRWEPLYALYYQSLHWVTGVEEGLDGELWYRVTDERLRVHSFIPAAHLRVIPIQELVPISPNVPDDEKRIQVSTEEQTLTAYEGEQEVLHTRIASGIHTDAPPPNGIETETPTGRFRVQTKMASRHMGNGELTADIEAYELVGVPWVCFFHKDGYALHGTYWHDNFGRKMSHGCINLSVEDARWLYRWTSPVVAPLAWYDRAMGTLLEIR